MGNPAVSVVVAFHNAGQTIGRTVESIAAQTASDRMEIVFVDDGSSDDSLRVLESAISKHMSQGGFPSFLILRHDRRKGVAAATDTGFRHADGEWVMRCDADDLLVPDAVERMSDAAVSDNADVVWCGFELRRGDDRRDFLPAKLSDPLNDGPVDTVQFSLCNKLIRRRLIVDNDLYPFEGVNCWEDLGVVSRVLALNPSIVYPDFIPYVYIVNPGVKSLSRSSRDTLLHDHLRCALLLEKWFVERGLADRYAMFLDRIKLLSKVKYLRGKGKNVNGWKSTFPEVNHRIMSITEVPFAARLAFAAVAKLPTSLSQRISDFLDIFYKG